MNGYERIMTALRGEQPDRVPTFELLINAPVIEALHPDLAIDKDLPWLLREHPHVLTTEAIALLMGIQAYTKEFLQEFLDLKFELEINGQKLL